MVSFRSREQVAIDFARRAKVCTACGIDKPFEAYYGNRAGSRPAKDGLTAKCKTCLLIQQREYQKTPGGLEANRRRSTNHTRRKNYGLTPEAYNSMHAGQLGMCAICGNPETKQTKTGIVQSLSVDHDHTTGVVRGLLCDRCNALLGRANDDIELLGAAIRYLQNATTLAEGN